MFARNQDLHIKLCIKFVYKIGSPQDEEKVQSFREKLELKKPGESGLETIDNQEK